MTGTHPTNRQIVLGRQPDGHLRPGDFDAVTTQVHDPDAGQVLVRVIHAIVAPGQRAFMQGETFREGTQVGDVIPGDTIAEVVSSRDSALRPGDLVGCWAGWQEYATLPASGIRPLGRPRLPLVDYLGLLGPNGLIAYFGITDAGRVRATQTVVVSAAAGGVGHLAGQMARIAGARVVGIVGSAEKSRVLVEQLGFDATVDRRAPDFDRQLAETCPRGVDVFFDNVAGAVLESVLPIVNIHGRIVCCGSAAEYDSAEQFTAGPRGLSLLMVTKRLTMQGVLVADYEDRRADATDQLIEWHRQGALRTLSTMRPGLDAAPGALIDLLAGRTIGQVGIQVGAEPDR